MRPWSVETIRLAPALLEDFVGQSETGFALANGYFGIRGSYEEDRPVMDPGTLLNGFYEHRPIVYGEIAYGFPAEGQSILNCPDERLIDSARKMLLEPTMAAGEVTGLCREAARRLPRPGAYYVRPMFYAMRGFVTPEPDSTEFALAVYASPMPEPRGLSVCFSSYRCPARDAAPTD